MDGKNVLLLFGGASTEHEISQRSARNILAGLRAAGYVPRIVGITKGGEWLPFRLEDEALLAEDWEERARAALAGEAGLARGLDLRGGLSFRRLLETLAGGPVDLVFPAVHGVNCEDGVLQGLLELSGLPYVGSGVLAAAMSMDKIACKKRLELERIPVVPYLVCTREGLAADLAGEIGRVAAELGYPCFVKPANGGSSIGTGKAEDAAELGAALKAAAAYDRRVLVEAYIPARELEVAVMGNEAAVAAEVGEVAVQAEGEYYDFENKYMNEEHARVSMPAPLAPEDSEALRALALRVYRTLDCRGLARVDFFKHKASGALYFNEINNLPGFTAISLFPQAFAHGGLELPELLRRLCALALEEFADKSRRTLRR